MASIEIRIPQLGEGLQEARIVRFLKQPGEPVAQDEPVFEMETDKAAMEIESPASGVLAAWTAQEEDVLPIGAVVGTIESEELGDSTEDSGDSIQDSGGSANPRLSTLNPQPSSPPAPVRNAVVPPRTRAYAREKGLSDETLARMALTAGGRLLPADIDRYLAEGEENSGFGLLDSGASAQPQPSTLNPQPASPPAPAFEDIPLPARQRALVYHMQRSAQAVIPATMEMAFGWEALEAARASLRARATGVREPSQFMLFAWCVAQAAKDHPRFRAAALNDATLRQYAHLHLGIAVARPDDELLMARVPDADTLPFDSFASTAQQAIERARAGEDQSSDAMQVILTNLSHEGVRRGIPVNVAPAAATLFLGEPGGEAYPLPGGGVGFRRVAHIALTFDHRLVNGVGAARFLADVRRRVESLDDALRE